MDGGRHACFCVVVCLLVWSVCCCVQYKELKVVDIKVCLKAYLATLVLSPRLGIQLRIVAFFM